MKTRLSALLDGELDVEESATVIADSHRQMDAREAARIYFLIGDALRGDERLDVDFTADVMARLADEPTVLAPRTRRHRAGPALAVAASLAGVAVVGWLALATPQEDRPLLARSTVSTKTPAVPTLAVQAPSAEMQEYLIAHQALSASLHLNSGAHQIRTVSYGDAGAGK
ncbi:hypothetical protein B9N43_03520 [Denitratisoma sp. DHT3]|uniref:sigma-E factor negative regulatory protein n=1 Tax=Denitratisoma sp. DHT3 TaxID=1981880 RepID=UPI001198B663|nr:sigma-E factor negative regulatory protein [Denitratisoma sp. DHT3]QDX80412.1 hypothetical protein B9N43_03520 [Denitratisoma sp. DHT3]